MFLLKSIIIFVSFWNIFCPDVYIKWEMIMPHFLHKLEPANDIR